MVNGIPRELASVLEDMRRQLASLADRVANLERPASVSLAAASIPAAPAQEKTREVITEEDILAISGALAAYFGVRVHIRQLRLISSQAWASEGRVTVQASHRLHG